MQSMYPYSQCILCILANQCIDVSLQSMYPLRNICINATSALMYLCKTYEPNNPMYQCNPLSLCIYVSMYLCIHVSMYLCNLYKYVDHVPMKRPCIHVLMYPFIHATNIISMHPCNQPYSHNPCNHA